MSQLFVALASQKKETEKKLEALEEKYISGDIDKDLFTKYSARYKDTLREIHIKIDNPACDSSNYKKAIFKAIEMASNLSQLWLLSDHNNK